MMQPTAIYPTPHHGGDAQFATTQTPPPFVMPFMPHAGANPSYLPAVAMQQQQQQGVIFVPHQQQDVNNMSLYASAGGGALLAPAGGDKKPILARRFRTELCRSTLAGLTCPYETRCMFAHCKEDLRTSEQNVADGLITEEDIKEWKAKQQQRARNRRRRGRRQQRATPCKDGEGGSCTDDDGQVLDGTGDVTSLSATPATSVTNTPNPLVSMAGTSAMLPPPPPPPPPPPAYNGTPYWMSQPQFQPQQQPHFQQPQPQPSGSPYMMGHSPAPTSSAATMMFPYGAQSSAPPVMHATSTGVPMSTGTTAMQGAYLTPNAFISTPVATQQQQQWYAAPPSFAAQQQPYVVLLQSPDAYVTTSPASFGTSHTGITSGGQPFHHQQQQQGYYVSGVSQQPQAPAPPSGTLPSASMTPQQYMEQLQRLGSHH